MPVDMHEHKFILELERLPPFQPGGAIDPDVRGVDFPAWRALFTSLLLWCHSTGYRLPSFDAFLDLCRKAYTHPRHRDRFARWFAAPDLPRTTERVKFWYESGLAETYLYVCLVDVFEDILQDGIVLYDARADWKQKWDVAVLVRGSKFVVNAFWGPTEDRGGVEEWRDAIERDRKANTALSAHWRNEERARWTMLAIRRTEADCQWVNGVRLFSIESVNRLIDQMCGLSGARPYALPPDRDARRRLYQSLVGRAAAPPRGGARWA